MPMTRSNCCRCWERIKVRSPPRIWMHTWTSSPFASTAGNRAVGECSSIACWKMPSQHSQRDIGLQEPTKQHQNTTCSGYCTKAATPLFVILLVLWLFGIVSSYTLGGFIHLLLVLAVVVLLIQLISGRRPVV